MNFRKHSDLQGLHAFLGASNWHWINYSLDKLDETYENAVAKQKGTELHEFAAMAIKLGQRLKGSKRTLPMYVNDALDYQMKEEQVLYYSPNCFGTADAISFRNNKLRIHDLKTGTVHQASFNQLKIYAALFCLEYNHKPGEIDIELRIYQCDEVRIEVPDADEISHIMDIICAFDSRLEELKTSEV